MAPELVAAKPDFIIIGAQRAASSWLNEALRRHPQVVSPRREVPYFEDPWFNHGYDPLRRIAAKVGQDQVWGFKRPNLLGLRECPSRIQAVAPRVKLLVTLREPIQRTVSAYNLYVRSRFLPPYPLNDGMRRLLSGDVDTRYPWAQEIISFGLYASHLARYRKHFPEQSFFVVLDDDLSRDSAATLRAAFQFCGADATRSVVAPHRRNEGVYSPVRIRVHRFAARAIHSRHSDGLHMRTRLGLFPRAMASGIRWADRVLLEPYTRNLPERLDQDVRQALNERFRPEVDDLEILLGRSLDPWRASMDGVAG